MSSSSSSSPPAPSLSDAEHVERIKTRATLLAESLTEAVDAGVSQALILPQLLLIFRQSFGDMPAGFKLPGMGG